MYEVYLVDDEAPVLSYLENSIPWIENGFEIIGKNCDSRIALTEILRLDPDVVFADINMPGFSGLDMIKDLKSRDAKAEVVVVSAYEKFEYAHRLLTMGGFDYLIKPVEEKQFLELFRRLSERLDSKNASRDLPVTSSDELNGIILFLNRNLANKHSLNQIAKQFNISASYICSLFSKHMKTTFSAYLTKIRMEQAARLLKNTNKAVKEVAALSGYEDYFYFCRVFRDYFSCTPTQFRK